MGSEFADILTPRLRLRTWRDEDLTPFAAMNAAPRVMEYLTCLLDRAGSDAAAAGLGVHFDEHGFGKCVVETRAGNDFVGVVGLGWCTFEAPINPSVEVGWRLAAAHWGKGYATEAARAALEYGFDELRLERITSFTVPANQRSLLVMQRLGMTYTPMYDFDHPLLPPDSPLRRHVTYVMRREDWNDLTLPQHAV